MDLPTAGDAHVAIFEQKYYLDSFELKEKIQSITWLDNGENLAFVQEENQVTIHTAPYQYGRNLVMRVAKIICE